MLHIFKALSRLKDINNHIREEEEYLRDRRVKNQKLADITKSKKEEVRELEQQTALMRETIKLKEENAQLKIDNAVLKELNNLYYSSYTDIKTDFQMLINVIISLNVNSTKTNSHANSGEPTPQE